MDRQGKEWERKVSPTLLPRKKWHTSHRNDIVLVLWEGKIVNKFKLAMVKEVFPDTHGVVRTVTVAMRGQHKREPLLPYKSKPLREMTIGVQRLVVFLPKEEQGEFNETSEDKEMKLQDAEITAKLKMQSNHHLAPSDHRHNYPMLSLASYNLSVSSASISLAPKNAAGK